MKHVETEWQIFSECEISVQRWTVAAGLWHVFRDRLQRLGSVAAVLNIFTDEVDLIINRVMN
jgi:hypothetical protein